MNLLTVLSGVLMMLIGIVAMSVIDPWDEQKDNKVPCYDKYGSIIIDTVCEGYSEEQRSRIETGELLLMTAFILFFVGLITMLIGSIELITPRGSF